MRRPVAILAALLMAAAIAAPAQAATLHRTFRASMGPSGGAGSTKIEAFTDGSGRVTYDLKNLRDRATYRVEIRKGRCGNLGIGGHPARRGQDDPERQLLGRPRA